MDEDCGGEPIAALDFNAVGDQESYARWTEATTYLVTLTDGGEAADEIVVDAGARYYLPECLFAAPEGMVFDQWLIGETRYYPCDPITVSEDLTVSVILSGAAKRRSRRILQWPPA